MPLISAVPWGFLVTYHACAIKSAATFGSLTNDRVRKKFWNPCVGAGSPLTSDTKLDKLSFRIVLETRVMLSSG